MSMDPEKALEELVNKLTIDRKVIAEEMLKWVDLLQEYLEFHEDLVVVKQQESLPRRAVLALQFIGKLMLYVAGRLKSPDLSLDEIALIISGGSDDPEIVVQEFLSAGWILMTSPEYFRLNFRKISEILREFGFVRSDLCRSSV